jgi:hypothetical protein
MMSTPVHHAQQFRRPPAARPQDARGVAVVHHDGGAVALGQVADLGQLRHVAVHREDAVGGDQAQPAALGLPQAALQVGHVRVAVAEAMGLAQADAVDDAGVVQLVAQDGVVLAQERLEQAGVGVEAGGVEDGVFLAEEAGDGGLQLLVQVLGAADEAHRGHAVAVRPEPPVGGLDHGRVAGQAEVVVGAEVDDLAAADRDGRALRPLDLALALEQAAGADVVELAAQHFPQGRVAHGHLRRNGPGFPGRGRPPGGILHGNDSALEAGRRLVYANGK